MKARLVEWYGSESALEAIRGIKRRHVSIYIPNGKLIVTEHPTYKGTLAVTSVDDITQHERYKDLGEVEVPEELVKTAVLVLAAQASLNKHLELVSQLAAQ